MDTIRPLPVFLGISGQNMCFSPEAFSPPIKKIDKSSPEKFKSRLKLNGAYFISNYALVAAGVCLVIALMHPGMLLSLGLLWGLWTFHGFLISNELVVFGVNLATILSITHRASLVTAITILVVVWKCLLPTITAVAISGVLVFAHATMRDPKQIEVPTNHRRDSDEEIVSSDSEVLVERPMVRRDVA